MRVCAASWHVSGPLDVGLLKGSIEFVVERHESLRTRIAPVDGVPCQLIDPTGGSFELIDIATTPEIEAESQRLAREFIQKQVDILEGPLFEVRLLRLSDRAHVLLLALDHFVSDGASYSILAKEIWDAYEQAIQGRRFSAAKLPVQFADYAVWLQQTYEPWLKQHGAYWRKRLADAPSTILPIDADLPRAHSPGGARLDISFDKSLTDRLREVARREKTLLSSVILTVYVLAIARWLNQRDLVVTLISHGRHRPQLENMIGPVSNHLHLRVEIPRNADFTEMLKLIAAELRSAYVHYDFDRVSDFIPECRTEVGFNWLPNNVADDGYSPVAGGALQTRWFPVECAWSSKFLPFFCDNKAEVLVSIAYCPGAFSADTIQRFGRDLRLLATELVQRPLTRICSVGAAS